MPIYTVEIDGKQYDIEGDRPPSESEARTAVGAHNSAEPPKAPPSHRDAIMGRLDQMEQRGAELRQDAMAHPVQTAATIALGAITTPGVMSVANKASTALPGVIGKAAGVVAKHPTAVSMATGAAPGVLAGNPMAAVMGAAMGFDRAPALGRRAARAAQRLGSVAPATVPRPVPPTASPIASPTAAPIAVPRPVAPAAAPATGQEAFLREMLAREPNWRTVDAVPVDAIKRDVTRGGSIIEAGESRIALGERLAAAVKQGDQAEIERLAKAIRQREHISAKRTN